MGLPSTASRAPRSAKPRTAADEAARVSLTPENWIDAATDVLVDQGIDHVRVDVLSKTLGVTRGSFYWHFKDRQDLLRHVLQAWRDRATEQVTLRFTHRESDPAVLLRELVSLPHRGRAAARAARIELAIRAWARRDEMARHAVDEADAARIAYQAQVFTQLGFSISEARMRAFMLYSTNVAESLLYRQGTPAQRSERAQFIERLLMRRLPGTAAG